MIHISYMSTKVVGKYDFTYANKHIFNLKGNLLKVLLRSLKKFIVNKFKEIHYNLC